jgi:predicted DCC family thiol-disulfide oxidoreductase YuxK
VVPLTGNAMTDTLITVFYDGHCGLCHGLVRFLIARDPGGAKFAFAPLQGKSCAAVIPQTVRQRLPDSIVVRTDNGKLLVKSSAVLYVLEQIGGAWRAISMTVNILPATLLDSGYDIVARMRRKVFSKPASTCPLVPADLQKRFRP